MADVIEEETDSSDIVNVAVRIHEWSAWLPVNTDLNHPDIEVCDGITAFPVQRGERVLEIGVTGTDLQVKGVDEDNQAQVSRLYAFQATILGKVPEGSDPVEFASPQPPPEKSIQLIEEIKKEREAQMRAMQAAQRGIVAKGMPGNKNMRPKR